MDFGGGDRALAWAWAWAWAWACFALVLAKKDM
jgi:hypothetical protein